MTYAVYDPTFPIWLPNAGNILRLPRSTSGGILRRLDRVTRNRHIALETLETAWGPHHFSDCAPRLLLPGGFFLAVERERTTPITSRLPF
jgi:hypothetical protein